MPPSGRCGHVARIFVRGVDELSEQALLLAMVEGSADAADRPWAEV